MRAALFAFSRGGCATARRVTAALPEAAFVCYTMAVSYTHLLDIAGGAVDMRGKTILPLDFTMAHDAAVREES